jgi:quercetin dioxygenase-like cupin family protein
MQVIEIDAAPSRKIEVPGQTRTIIDTLTTTEMTTHVGIFPPGQSSSEHSHPNSDEIVYVVKGEGTVKAGGVTKQYRANHLVHIPRGMQHQYTNTGNGELVLFVVYNP